MSTCKSPELRHKSTLKGRSAKEENASTARALFSKTEPRFNADIKDGFGLTQDNTSKSPTAPFRVRSRC
ncbi:hypothetical protein X777_00880 [Ooceraea biroi]|uniref:Uncharacterized protein n=1 Tax=Ooceraea biroi TaxID=2015173 RepID=A0A026WP87_OOCBI|nr:hypothetical protein X777_00880 [Ooceraea biroi]